MRNRILTLFMVVGLVACSPAMGFLDNSNPGDVIFEDSFSNPSSGWEHSMTSVGSLDYYEDTYRIKVDHPDYDLWSVTQVDFQDVRLEVDAARKSGPQENRFGLICRYQDASNFYFFIISSDGYYSIGKVDAGTHALLGQPTMAFNKNIVTTGAPNHLRFDCVNNTLTGYVNGQIIAITQDASFKKGNVGLIAGTFAIAGADITFDDFIVFKP